MVNARRMETECNPEHLFLRMIQFRNLQVISFENKFKLERSKPQKSSYFVLIWNLYFVRPMPHIKNHFYVQYLAFSFFFFFLVLSVYWTFVVLELNRPSLETHLGWFRVLQFLVYFLFCSVDDILKNLTCSYFQRNCSYFHLGSLVKLFL